MANQLGIREDSALKTYFGDDWPVTMADSLEQAVGDVEDAHSGPAVMVPTVVAAQLVSALGVAAKFAVVNAEHARRDECVSIGADAGDALTVLGVALKQGSEDGIHAASMPVVNVERKGVHLADGSLRRFAARLADGTWRDCWCGADDLEHVDLDALRRQVEHARELVQSLLAMR